MVNVFSNITTKSERSGFEKLLSKEYRDSVLEVDKSYEQWSDWCLTCNANLFDANKKVHLKTIER